jgi:hypothetical protein
MKKVLLRKILLSATLFGSMAVFFQNCDPSQITSGFENTTFLGSLSNDSGSTLGYKVDLLALLASSQELPSNVLYPSSTDLNQTEYTQGAPILENMVLLKNDFNRIEWIHGPSSTVIALGDSFNQKAFTSDLIGVYYVFGYRGSTPFLIHQFRLVSKTTPNSGVTSANAVQLNQKLVASDMQNESILVTFRAPGVDLKSTQFTLSNTGFVSFTQRAILVTKPINESINVEVKLSDTSGQTFVGTLNLIAKTMASLLPAPTPTPVPPVVSGQSYYIVNACGAGNKVMEISGASQADNALAAIATLDMNQPAQAFKFEKFGLGYKITAQHSGKTLNIANASFASKALLEQYTFTGTDSEIFRLLPTSDGYYQMQNVNSGLYINLINAMTTDGNGFEQYLDSTACAEKFKFSPL